MANEKILVVDDEKEIAELLEIYLVSDGYQVFKASNAYEGLDILKKEDIKLALIDIMMPGMNGLDMCKKIRETSNIPVIMVSAKSSELDKIMGLSNGADDYVTKPFSPLEVSARVKSQLRRFTTLNPGAAKEDDDAMPQEINLGGLTINTESHRVWVYDKEVKFTPTEFDILVLLASHPGKVYSIEDIFEEVWHEDAYEANNTVMVHIRRVRTKLGDDVNTKKFITTVWGVGYKMEV